MADTHLKATKGVEIANKNISVQAWVNFDSNGTINADHNVSGISGTTSPYTISFDVAMNGAAKYAVSASSGAASGGAINYSMGTAALNAANFQWHREQSNGTAGGADDDAGSAIAIGEAV